MTQKEWTCPQCKVERVDAGCFLISKRVQFRSSWCYFDEFCLRTGDGDALASQLDAGADPVRDGWKAPDGRLISEHLAPFSDERRKEILETADDIFDEACPGCIRAGSGRPEVSWDIQDLIDDYSMGETEADMTLNRLEELRKSYKPTYYGGEDPADESRDW